MASQSESDAMGLDLRIYRSAIRRHRILGASLMAGCVLLAGTYTALATPQYRAQASVLIENKADTIVGGATASVPINRDVTQAQKALAESKPVIQRAAEIAGTARWVGEPDGPEKPLDPLGEKVATPMIEGQLLVLKVLNKSPERSAVLANAWVTAFVEEMVRRDQSSSLYTRDFLDQQIPALREEWIKKQEKLQAFQIASKFDPLEFEKHPIRQREADLAQQLTQARIKAVNLKSESDAWTASDGRLEVLFQLPRARSDAKVQSYEQMLRDHRQRRVELLQRYRPDSSALKQAEEGEQEFIRLSNQVLQALSQQIQIELRIATDELRELETMHEAARKEFEELKGKAAQHQVLAFEAQMARRQYEDLTNRQRQADVAGRVQFSYAQPWERAEVPDRPYSPSWPKNLALGLCLGLLLASAGIYMAEALDDTVHSSKQFKDVLGLDLLGQIPEMPAHLRALHPYQAAIEAPRIASIEALKTVRANLMVGYGSVGNHSALTMLVTSAGPGEGKTFIATNLAILMAQTDKRVLVVDMDIHRGTLTRVFEADANQGLTDLCGSGSRANLPAVGTWAVPTRVPGISMLTCGTQRQDPPDVSHSPLFRAFLQEARSCYDVILIDSPPLLYVSDAANLAELCDLSLVVTYSRKTRLPHAARVSEILQRSKAQQCLYLLNGVNESDSSMGGYGYGYGYPSSGGSSPDKRRASQTDLEAKRRGVSSHRRELPPNV